MDIETIRQTAFTMPLGSPAVPCGPYRFIDREYMILTYRTDRAALERVVPAPLEVADDLVNYEFIRMPDSTGFGAYTESGQVIPVTYQGQRGTYTHSMYLNDHPPIAAGRELWGFPKKLATPHLELDLDTLVGTLDYGRVRIAVGAMGYKHHTLAPQTALAALQQPGYLLKIVPHVDGTTRLCELVRFHLEDIVLKGAWTGPGALDLRPHALAPIANLPVREIVSATHILADLTLGLGEVVYDYLAKPA